MDSKEQDLLTYDRQLINFNQLHHIDLNLNQLTEEDLEEMYLKIEGGKFIKGIFNVFIGDKKTS